MRLIDADALLDDCIFSSEAFEKGMREFIGDAPTIEERKKGKWEVIDEVPPRRYGCSICKKLSWYQYNYCPNCGAKMEAEE